VKQSQQRWRPLCFEGDHKKVVNFFEEKGYPGGLARGCSDLEMTWLLTALAPPLSIRWPSRGT